MTKSKQSLTTRVKSHNTQQTTSGVLTLALTKECLDHWADPAINDWTPLAHLIGGAQPAQSRIVRKVVGAVINGWAIQSIKNPDKGNPLVAFRKVKGANQGFDDVRLAALNDLVDAKVPVQSKKVVGDTVLFPSSDKVEKTAAELLEARLKADQKWMKDNGVSLEAYIAKLTTLRGQ